jgi:hypothetical protein
MNAPRQSCTLLLEDDVRTFRPKLAVALRQGRAWSDLDGAIFVSQLNYWLQRSKTVEDGRKWVYKTLEEWAEEFIIWSPDTINRIIDRLRERGVVIARTFKGKGRGRTLYYTLDFDLLEDLTEKAGICGMAPVVEGASEGDSAECAGEAESFPQVAEIAQQEAESFPQVAENHFRNLRVSTTGPKNTSKNTSSSSQAALLEEEVTQAPAAQPSRKPSGEKSEDKPSKKNPPSAAVEAYREVRERYPNKAGMLLIDAAGITDLELWKKCVAVWIGRGYKPTNIDGMLSWYRQGFIPGQGEWRGNANGNGAAATGSNGNSVLNGNGTQRAPVASLGQYVVRDGKRIKVYPNVTHN